MTRKYPSYINAQYAFTQNPLWYLIDDADTQQALTLGTLNEDLFMVPY